MAGRSGILQGIGSVQRRIDAECTTTRVRGLDSDAWDSDASRHYLTAYDSHEDQIDELETSVGGLVRVLRDAAAS